VSEETGRKNRKEFVGTVKSAAMDKSIVVDILTPRPDRLYRKYIKSTKRVMAHDEKNAARPGDRVRVVECRPLSKRKCWRLVEIVEKGRAALAEEAGA
jgi:small subunit ribosomal protein S17